MRHRLRATLVLALCLATPSCETVAETGRSQFIVPGLTPEFMAELGAEAYAEATGGHRILTGTPDAQMLQRVGRRIAAASGRDYAWEFRLLDAPDVVNAFCLPGGKIAVFTGILPICANEAGLAVVLGHEVAHATAQHGAERLSQGILAELVLGAAAIGLDQTEWNDETKGLVLAALGIASTLFVLLPYSRDHETEADEIGLRFTIRAGYDPHEAPRFWERMARLGDAGPEFLSTHPDPVARAQRLRELIPRLVAEEQAAARGGGRNP
jgi:predicted Zn-dependent protease